MCLCADCVQQFIETHIKIVINILHHIDHTRRNHIMTASARQKTAKSQQLIDDMNQTFLRLFDKCI
jgi:hypothetical protein